MSRKGKQSIPLAKGVEIKTSGNTVHVKGPKGALEQAIPEGVLVKVEGTHVNVSLADSVKNNRTWHGLYQSLIHNMVIGTSTGFEIKLELIGVGYRAVVQGTAVELQVGFSHPAKVAIPAGVTVKVEKNTISVSGIDKQVVGQLAASLRAVRPPEPFQGKGIRYVGEYVRKKAGKAAAAAKAK